ncbi:acyltransferase [Novosphingobium sp. BL-8H]|uniref:acyltransferase family protein n=1 Tax=Novosphingobium sp. BL-8H TaxID=3127640 RepID=UPI00375691CC
MRVVEGHRRLAQLTSLRFFAALLVMLSHLVFFEQSANPALRAGYDLFLRQGACGVTFFFILSGFILTHAYEGALTGGEVSAPVYLYRRVARIFPLHLAVALAVLAYLFWRGDPPPGQAIALNLTLLHSWSPDPLVHYSMNGPSWSLSDELFFYALFPLLLKLDGKVLARAFVAGMMAITTGALLAALWVDGYSPQADWLFYVFPVTRLGEFVAGILLCRAWRHGVGRSWAGSGAEVLLVLLVPATMIAAEWFAVPLVFRYQLAFMPPMAALVLVFAHGEGVISRALRNPALQLLGEASFALYLIHRPLILFAARWAGRGVAEDLALAIAMLALAVAASIATYRWFDRPVDRWLRRQEATLFARRLAA